MTAEKKAQKAQVDSREDFMKRLFAVAVSVGFAAPLTRMAWITNGSMPNTAEWHQIVILATALLATIGSWEGYFSAIDSRPLKSIWRFSIDIILVLVYMILLISSIHQTFFLPIFTIIFLLYVIWDALTIYEYSNYYYYDKQDNIPPSCIVLTTYWRGFFSRNAQMTVRRGHIVTMLWAIYFAGVLAMKLVLAFDNVYVMCAMASLGLLAYRRTKVARYDESGNEKQKTECTIISVALVVFGLLVVTAILGVLFKN